MDVATVTNFKVKISEIESYSSSFIALAFLNRLECYYSNLKIFNSNGLSTYLLTWWDSVQ